MKCPTTINEYRFYNFTLVGECVCGGGGGGGALEDNGSHGATSITVFTATTY